MVFSFSPARARPKIRANRADLGPRRFYCHAIEDEYHEGGFELNALAGGVHPGKYNLKSNLTVEVTAAGDNRFDFVLSSKK